MANELLWDDLENKSLPQHLQSRHRGFEFYPELTALLIDLVFPLRLDSVVEKTQGINSSILTINVVPIKYKLAVNPNAAIFTKHDIMAEFTYI